MIKRPFRNIYNYFTREKIEREKKEKKGTNKKGGKKEQSGQKYKIKFPK